MPSFIDIADICHTPFDGGRSVQHLRDQIRARETSTDLQTRLDAVWAAVNVLGAPDSACTTDGERAYCQAIGDALAEIERLGGRPS